MWLAVNVKQHLRRRSAYFLLSCRSFDALNTFFSAIWGLPHEAHECQKGQHRLTAEEHHPRIRRVRQDCLNSYSSTSEDNAAGTDQDKMRVWSDPGVNTEHYGQT